MTDTLDNSIQQNTQGPESTDVDCVKVKQHSLPDQIAAGKHLPDKGAQKSGLRVRA